MDRPKMLQMYRNVREASLAMCAPLEPEDYQVQPSEEVSPPKWNLGHTSWFFWMFLLRPAGLSLPVDESYAYLLNSYYHRAGLRGLRGARGMRTRPTVDEIYRYRRSVDERMERLIDTAPGEGADRLLFLLTVGVNHEQQHQELFHTEIKNIYHGNVRDLRPAYRPRAGEIPSDIPAGSGFVSFDAGLYDFGNVEGGWCWDNELCVHKAFLNGFALQTRLVTNGEYMEFMEDGGYSNSLFWLSDGWAEVERRRWTAPLYWEKMGDMWWSFTLSGTREVDAAEPVCHVSFYEACAFANWKSQVDSNFRNVRLPTEREWEHAARTVRADPARGNFVESGFLHPAPVGNVLKPELLSQLFGDAWEWTLSHYEPYPGFQEFPDNLSEYNGKFMNNQRVLRGGSCVTPGNHMRLSYRNFWHPATRFQFSGIRLARANE